MPRSYTRAAPLAPLGAFVRETLSLNHVYVGRVCTTPMNDLLPSSYNDVVAEDTVVVLETATGGIISIGLYVSWNQSSNKPIGKGGA